MALTGEDDTRRNKCKCQKCGARDMGKEKKSESAASEMSLPHAAPNSNFTILVVYHEDNGNVAPADVYTDRGK